MNIKLIKCPNCGKYLDIETLMCVCGYEEKENNGKTGTTKDSKKKNHRQSY
jgi:hypothetical protein